MKKNAMYTGFVFLMMLFLLTGCTKLESSNAEITIPHPYQEPLYDWGTSTGETLVCWSEKNELNRNYMKKAFQRYEEKTGNKLEIVEIPKEEYQERIKAAFSGIGEQPDILLSYGGTNIEGFSPDENFYDFTEAVWVDDLTGMSINQTIFNGKVIGLPHWEASISGTLYNKKIFKQYGIKVPRTQEEFMSVCEKLKNNGITPVYLPYAEVSMLLYQFPLDTIVQDSAILDSLNNGTLNYADIPEMKTIVQWYQTMDRKGYFGEDYQTQDWNGMNTGLASEKYAMMLCWDTWLYTDFQGDASDFGIMPAFMGVPEEGTFEGPNLGLLIVNKNSPKVTAAVDFITFMADPYNYNIAFEGIYTAPVFKKQVASISTPQYAEAERLIESNYLDSTAWLRIRGFSQMDASCIQKAISDTNGEYTIEQCLKDMDSLRKERFFAQED